MMPRDIFPRSLQYLIAIAEYGSYTKAAEALFVSQPTLSQQIKQLEESLTIPLLDRSGRTVKLTDAGEIYVYHARRSWAELESGARAIMDVEDLSRGSLRLGWTPITDFLTCSLLEKYNKLYPGITLSTLELPADEIETAVVEDRIDFGIVFSKPIAEKPKPKPKTRLVEISTHTLFKETLCLAIGNEHHRVNHQGEMTAKELGNESLVLLNTNFTLRQQIDNYCNDNVITPNIAMETDSLSVIIEMVQVGSLATILPKSIIFTHCGIHSITLTPALPQQEITAISRRDRYKRPACKAFAKLAIELEWPDYWLKLSNTQKKKTCHLAKANKTL